MKHDRQTVVSGLPLWAVVSVLALTLWGNALAEDEIRIGILCGPDSAGEAIQWASQMASDEINDRGGVLGKKIRLIVGSTKSKPVIGAYEYSRLASQENVAAVLGISSSDVALAVMEQVQKQKVPLIITGAAAPVITEKIATNYEKYKYAFRTFGHTEEVAGFTTGWLVRNLVMANQLKRVAIMTENARWALPLGQLWVKTLRGAGVDVPVFEYFDAKTKDFSSAAAKIREAGAEAVLLATAHTDPSDFIRLNAEENGPIVAGIIGFFPMLSGAIQDKCIGTATLGYPGLLGLTERDAPFHQKYMQIFQKNPDYTAPYTYDTVYILKNAIEKAGNTDPDNLTAALEAADYEGIMGRWAFDRSHHTRFGPGYRQNMIVQWHSPEKMCVVWPENIKNCDLIFPPWWKREQG